ncbi:MAG TPA: hypothetical protein VMW83_14815 [Spirochaetia bacterium]|nr:hypothetical protein [Spirochaetia bacterium]
MLMVIYAVVPIVVFPVTEWASGRRAWSAIRSLHPLKDVTLFFYSDNYVLEATDEFPTPKPVTDLRDMLVSLHIQLTHKSFVKRNCCFWYIVVCHLAFV